MRIDEFNEMDAADARALALVWAAIPRWADGVVVRRPYSSAEELAEIAERLTRTWGRVELDAALAHHPRIGAKVSGADAEAAASRSEQSSMADADAGVAARIAAGNVAYERRFGRVFLIRAAGRTPDEMLAALESRLTNSDGDEVREAVAQLAEIALLRLRSTVHEPIEARMPS
ncbi:2-oxo-4-hydroxy-4-carboxy-5-ureidoimidazoline decarboxylase [Planococcus sp. APC 4015]|nr:2-oxo-4-hydroxy-4-carboxy-5-ureidoimidazoline decarboxylase [Planococcus sp. APC 4015]